MTARCWAASTASSRSPPSCRTTRRWRLWWPDTRRVSTGAMGVRVGEARVPLDARGSALRTGETNVGNYVADVMRRRPPADVAMMNGGGIRGNQIVPAGPLSRKDVNALVPFLNVLVILELPGSVLLDALERSVSVYPGVRRVPPGLRPHLHLRSGAPTRPARRSGAGGGQPLDPERRYSLALNNYTAQGGDGYAMLATAKPLVFPEDGPGLAETLLQAIERAGSIAPGPRGGSRAWPLSGPMSRRALDSPNAQLVRSFTLFWYRDVAQWESACLTHRRSAVRNRPSLPRTTSREGCPDARRERPRVTRLRQHHEG